MGSERIWTMPGEFAPRRNFGGGPGNPPANPPPPQAADSDVQAAAASARAAARKRRGRGSTILAQDTASELQTPSTGKTKIGD